MPARRAPRPPPAGAAHSGHDPHAGRRVLVELAARPRPAGYSLLRRHPAAVGHGRHPGGGRIRRLRRPPDAPDERPSRRPARPLPGRDDRPLGPAVLAGLRKRVNDLVGLAPSNHGTVDAEAACTASCPAAFWQQRAARGSPRRSTRAPRRSRRSTTPSSTRISTRSWCRTPTTQGRRRCTPAEGT